MVLVSVSRPESTLDRKSFLHRQTNCLVSEYMFVVEAMFTLRDDHLHTIDAALKKEVFIADQLIHEVAESVKVRVQSSPGFRICARSHRLVVTLDFVRSSSMFAGGMASWAFLDFR